MRIATTCAALLIVLQCFSSTASGQGFGIELHNTVMPASGGMGGVSIAAPQDVQSAVNGNPATLTQLRGTQFGFGGMWIEATYNVEQPTPLPFIGVTPYGGKSTAPGTGAGVIGVTQELTAMGLPATIGMAFVPNAGSAVDFRHIPGSNGTQANLASLDIVNAFSVLLNERVSVGGSLAVGTSFLDGPFTASSSMTTDYALRGKIGTTYKVSEATTLGAYWESEKDNRFDNLVKFGAGSFLDVAVEHPENIGVGIANQSLLDGRLLLAADLVFKNYSETDFFRAIYRDQWIVQLGAQLQTSARTKLRMGYVYAENPLRPFVPVTIGGVTPPGGVPGINYIQAQFAAMNRHRITGGISLTNLLPGVDFDVFGGGMLRQSQTFGTTTASLQTYFVGAGLTWRFNRGACCTDDCGVDVTCCE